MLFLEHVPALYAWSRLRLDGSGVEPEDVIQEVWLRGSRELARFDPARGTFRAWIFQVTKSAVLEALRGRAARVLPSPTGLPRPRLTELPEPVTSLTRRVARDEALEHFVAELWTLETRERELVVHCGIEGRTAADAGRLLGISEEAARKLWQRLRERLRTSTRLLALVEP